MTACDTVHLYGVAGLSAEIRDYIISGLKLQIAAGASSIILCGHQSDQK